MLRGVTAPARLMLTMLDRHLGNFVVASPVIRELVRQMPDAQVLLRPPTAQLAERIPGFPRSAIMEFREREGRLAALSTLQTLLAVRRTHPTISVDFGGSSAGALITALSNARRRIGPSSNDWQRRLTESVRKPADQPHRFHSYLAIGQTLQPDLNWRNPELAATAQDQVAAEKLLASSGISPESPIACLHVSAGKDYKYWPFDRYAAVIDRLADQGIQSVLIGAGEDRAPTTAVHDACCSSPLDLVGQVDLGALIGLFGRARLFIGNDSGPMHIAAATGVPIVALFGPTDPARWGPMTDRVAIVRGSEPMSDVSAKRKFAAATRMDSIPVDAVYDAAQTMLLSDPV